MTAESFSLFLEMYLQHSAQHHCNIQCNVYMCEFSLSLGWALFKSLVTLFHTGEVVPGLLLIKIHQKPYPFVERPLLIFNPQLVVYYRPTQNSYIHARPITGRCQALKLFLNVLHTDVQKFPCRITNSGIPWCNLETK